MDLKERGLKGIDYKYKMAHDVEYIRPAACVLKI
jgi:hypothetical protein